MVATALRTLKYFKTAQFSCQQLLLLLPSTQSSSFSVQKMSSNNLDSIPKVDIDPEGVFKYVLIRVYGKEQNEEEPSTVIVRGYKRCFYHSEIFEEVEKKLEPLDCEPLGGGRMSHDPGNKKIHIYGYSQGYGKAAHEVTAKLVKDLYSDYTVTISDEGY